MANGMNAGMSVAGALDQVLARIFPRGVPVRFDFWDGSSLGPTDGPPGRVMVKSPDALRRLAWAPGELGVARAFVVGDIDFEGDIFTLLRQLRDGRSVSIPSTTELIGPTVDAARRLGLVGPPPRPPEVEIRLSPWRSGSVHSKTRDEKAVTHHYDVGNDFYRLVLGPSMTYSCARFTHEDASLEEAQAAKHDLVCRKLGLHERPGARLLDVGCGWGSMAMHAARTYEAQVVGVTLSPAQAELARRRVEDEGLSKLVEIRIEDYRDLGGERFDAISSIGMFEHVGKENMAAYFETLASLLAPRGRLLNHAISKPGGSRMSGRTFINRYVFPDGELIDVSEVVAGMQRAGFEVRDVESLREHYAKTLRHWVANLEDRFDDAVALAGAQRARVWRLYMAGSANSFEENSIAVHQVLGVRTDDAGESGMPLTRAGWD